MVIVRMQRILLTGSTHRYPFAFLNWYTTLGREFYLEQSVKVIDFNKPMYCTIKRGS